MGTIERGPNLNLEDHTESIRSDPMFSAWRNPVPPEWFSASKRAYTLVDQTALYGSLEFAQQLTRTAADNITIALDTPDSNTVRLATYRRSGSDLVDEPIDMATGVVGGSGSGPLGTGALGTSTAG